MRKQDKHDSSIPIKQSPHQCVAAALPRARSQPGFDFVIRIRRWEEDRPGLKELIGALSETRDIMRREIKARTEALASVGGRVT